MPFPPDEVGVVDEVAVPLKVLVPGSRGGGLIIV